MNDLLPEQKKINISQSTDRVTRKAFEKLDQVILVVPRGMKKKHWNALPYHVLLQKALRKSADRGAAPAATVQLPNAGLTTVSIAIAQEHESAFERLTMARKMAAAARRHHAARVGICIPGFSAIAQEEIAQALVAACLAGAFDLPNFKSKGKRGRKLSQLRLLGLAQRFDLSTTTAGASGNNLARWLTAMPANKLDAGGYRKAIADLAKTHGWEINELDIKALKRRKAGAFLAVAQGNGDPDAAIVHLKYRPDGKKSKAPDLALVGKGICFDTGGTNLKPFNSMLRMHTDMGGSAVVLGILASLTELKSDLCIDAWLAITENRTSAHAYKPQDLVTASNGTTIQVIHTDAEGRMVLADTLVFASKTKPRLIVDFATLTGACITSITNRMSGVFTNRPDLHPVLKRAGRESGERVWPFPMDDDFEEAIKSRVADIMQCAPGGPGDHILAARFLNRFVSQSIPWIHVDLSACEHKGGLAHIASNITGFGVRFALDLLKDPAITGLLESN